ncbi:hypothetical protein [Litchfieldia alkalitelluris]|uniref:hypothetical protein n=1 Tax=Litchfieldia alkalitelluris TaxID=304268 RepID=UPI000997B95A|nr:hypothetical protein [Litchfieldia alkalitelluris]
MNVYEITHLIVDDEFYGEEMITVNINYNHKDYSITLRKDDFEIINMWTFEGDKSLPANLPDSLIENIKEDLKKI